MMDKTREILEEFVDRVEDAAFSSRAPNPLAPKILQQVVAVRHELIRMDAAGSQERAAKVAPAWVSCAERLPTEEDADYRGQVWFCSSVTMPCLVLQEEFGAGQVAPNVYWMPTGLVQSPQRRKNR